MYLCCFINKMEYKWDGLMNDDGADNRIIEGGGIVRNLPHGEEE